MDAVRRSTDARAVASRWRGLTGGSSVRDRDRRTLVACSGGGDSTALLLALAGASPEVVVAHVVHDLRDPAATLAERDAVRDMAASLGLALSEAQVSVRDRPGNTEANARRARYEQLERMALEAGCPYVATGHQANDQLETILMALIRGAGVRGLAGIPPRRRLGSSGVRLVRPMLALDRTDAEVICRVAGAPWATDATNADCSRLRAAVRHGPAADLLRLRPGAAGRIASTAATLRAAASVLEASYRQIVAGAARDEDSISWPRDRLARHPTTVLSGALREAFHQLREGRDSDRLTARSLTAAALAIRDGRGPTREFEWTGARLVIDRHSVSLRKESVAS